MFRLPQYMLTVSPGGGGKAAGEWSWPLIFI
jgi:hypothetical protein